MPSSRTIAWLKFASLVVFAFGIVIAFAAAPAAAAVARLLADIIFWPFDGAQDLGAREARLLSAIGGGVMAGWGALLWLVSAYGFRSDPVLARRAILVSIATWFAIDSAASMAAGAPVNAVLNLGFLAAFVAPLWRPEPVQAEA